MKIFSQTISFLKNYFLDKERSHSRIIQFSKISVIVNIVIALGKIIMGICSLSVFLCINGLYNFGIGLAKAVAIKGYSDSVRAPIWTLNPHIITPHKQHNENVGYRYFYLVGIITLIKTTRKNMEPILEAIKQTCFASSLIAFVLVQTAILSHAGREPNIYLDSVGIALGAVSVLISLHMIISVKMKIINKTKKYTLAKTNKQI